VALLLTLAAPILAQQQRHDTEQALKALVAALNVCEGSVVADVGAGSGDYSVPLAKVVGPTGRVVAVDINAKALERLRARADREQLTNVEAVRGEINNPKLAPESVDAVLIVNAYHEVTEYRAMLAHIRDALKPEGRLVIADFASPSRRTQPRDAQTARHEIAPELVLQDLRTAGFHVIHLEDPFSARGHDNGNHVEWLLTAVPNKKLAAKTSDKKLRFLRCPGDSRLFAR
jgi:ubiquinone/menaquinone biosynthesis C-methylase UbiE